LWPPGFLNSTYPANRFSTMAFRCRHLKTATSVPWRRERKVLRLEAKTTFTKAFSKESACKSRAVSRKYRIMDLAGDHLSFRNFFRLIGPDSREPSKLKGEQRCPLLFFNSGFPAQRLLVALPDSSEGAPKLQPHNPAHPVPRRGFWRNPPIKRNRRFYENYHQRCAGGLRRDLTGLDGELLNRTRHRNHHPGKSTLLRHRPRL